MPIYVILLWVVWNKNKNKFMFDQSGQQNRLVVFVKDTRNRPAQKQLKCSPQSDQALT